MAKSTYIIKVINKGREKDYFDFWKRKLSQNAAGEALNPELVGFAVPQEARNAEEAVELVRRKHPGLQVDTQATLRQD
ncbi:hypothetical protein D0B54_05565 [Solimonas sp. K1W22B-7]|uniref:hypothetical protein n=1 Tax=Solimonas sp. K1W22B-7 TaxID=2303331 RepID=UPI000E3342A3|nr:hypothetical protein [Solimonas sp. K1W22B-7]AXQ28175.1 hypothetical protein D0B54_05565 [Solimonas sp. K1W22B-7]